MRGQIPILEHVLLTSAMFAILILSYTSYFEVSQILLDSEKEASMTLISEKVARAVIMAYEMGKDSTSPFEPVSKVTIDLPDSIAGAPYRVYYNDGNIITSSKNMVKTAGIFSIGNRLNINGEIYSTISKRPQVKYYSESNLIILGYENWKNQKK